jgi:ketosteroid isomerase-like protein
MKKLLMILPLVFLLCFAFGCQQAEEVAEEPGVKALTDEDIAAIKAIGPALDEVVLAGDWNGVVSLFTEDVVLMGPNSPIIKGGSALRELLETSGMKYTEHKVELLEINGYGDIAYARGIGVEAFSIEGVDEPIKDEYKVLAIFRKRADSSWRIAIWSWNSDLPLPE